MGDVDPSADSFAAIRRDYALQCHAQRWASPEVKPETPPGPIKQALARPPTAEELKAARAMREPEPERRAQKPAPVAMAAAGKPAPGSRLVVYFEKDGLDYELEYHKQAPSGWVLVDFPPQLEPLRRLPVSEHRAAMERLLYVFVDRQVI